MRALKLIVNALVLFVFLPVAIVAVLGIAFSPLQPTARAIEPRAAFEASDIMWEGPGKAETPSVEVEATEPIAQAEPARGPAPEAMEADGESLDANEEAAVEADEQPADAEGGVTVEPAGNFSSEQLRTQGVIDGGGYRYTWYSQRVLPGDGLDIEGRHVSAEGYVVDGQDRIVVASSDLPRGTELAVPFGSGSAIVLDTGCASGTLDIYTDF